MQFVVFCTCLNLFSSKVFLAMASAKQCDSNLDIQIQDQPGNAALVPVVGVGVDW